MNILFLSAWFPFPPNNGSKLRIYNLLRGLAQVHEVTLLTFSDEPESGSRPIPAELAALCRKVYRAPRRAYNPKSVRSGLGLFCPTPRSIIDTYEPLMAGQIRRELQAKNYQLVVASQWAMASYWRPTFAPPALFEEVELGAFEDRDAPAFSPLSKFRHQLTLFKLQHYVRRTLPTFRACTVASEKEAEFLRCRAPRYEGIEVLPNCVDLANYDNHTSANLPEPETLIFSGSFRYFANHEAMAWFLRDIFPSIQNQVPGVRLTITGDPAGLSLPPASNVNQTGFVADVRSLIASSQVSLAPIRYGGGTRLKILEAMALHTPVVATSKGAEGLEVQSNKHLLIADTPAAFAEAVIRLLQEPGLRRQLADNAYQLVRAKYDWGVVMPRFLDLVEQATWRKQSASLRMA